jgi:protein-S-isoprenylcysteine O-methyltransferase Ste14
MRYLEHRIPPPIVLLLTGGIMWLLSRFGPRLVFAGRVPLGVAIVVAGVIVAAMGVRAFRRAGTTINPVDLTRSTTLVTSGIYRVTRNPMYLGMVVLLLGVAVLLAAPVTLLACVAFVLFINRFQIVPEERVLRERFGESYSKYAEKVRRWI